MCQFTLYVSVKTAKTKVLLADVKSFLSEALRDRFTLHIVEVLKNPDLALQGMILATPTLVKNRPGPTRQVTGSFRNKQRVLEGLEIELLSR